MMLMEDDDEEMLELQKKFQQDAINIYEAKVKRKRETIREKESEIRKNKEQLKQIAQGAKKKRGKDRGKVEELDPDLAKLLETTIEWDEEKNTDEQDFKKSLSDAKANYQQILLHYDEHCTLLDKVIEEKELIISNLKKKIAALSGDRKGKEKVKSKSSSQKLVRREDFDLLSVLGHGAFGKVWRVREKATGEIYAMKVMKKQSIVKRDFVDHTNKEREIMADMSYHPFFVKLFYSFQTDDSIYLIMEMIAGGSLFDYLCEREDPFSEDVARFYAAEVLLALEALHFNNIIYRDLKLENLLLDGDGNVRLSDFGLSAIVADKEGRVNSFSGTATYLAPEILNDNGEGHGRSVDIWCFGVMLFIMLTQEPPFWSENARELFEQIKSHQLDFRDWPFLSPEAVSLLRGLLTRNPEQRIGCGNDGVKPIKSHAFFADIDWDKLYAKKLQAPFKPEINLGTACDANESLDDEDDDEEGNSNSSSNKKSKKKGKKEHYPPDLFAGFSFVAQGLASEQTQVLRGKQKKRGSGRNKVRISWLLQIKGIKGLDEGINDERVYIKWKFEMKRIDKGMGKGRTKKVVCSDRSASFNGANHNALIPLEVTLNQDKKSLKLEERKLTLTLMADTKKGVTLGEVTVNLSDFAIHNGDNTQIFSLAQNGPTIVLHIKCEWRLFNGKLLQQNVKKGEAGEILHLGGTVYFLISQNKK